MPMRIAILNLMPLKEVTERDFLRILSRMPQPVEIHWMRLRSHVPKHASQEHMDALYEYFDELETAPDGLIVTGAPVEQIDFEQVTYWPELCAIFDWARTAVKSTFRPLAGMCRLYTSRRRSRLSATNSAFALIRWYSASARRLTSAATIRVTCSGVGNPMFGRQFFIVHLPRYISSHRAISSPLREFTTHSPLP